MTSLDLIWLLLIAISLSIDCFAVAISISISLKTPSPLQISRVALSFGVFQALMTLIGWLIGQTIVGLIEAYDHWLAFGLLTFIGLRMFREAFRSKGDEKNNVDMTKGLILLGLAIATSIDALAVGLTFSLLEVNIALASSVIGITAVLATIIGFALGKRVGKLFGKRAEAIGGVVLIAIGLRILLTHIL